MATVKLCIPDDFRKSSPSIVTSEPQLVHHVLRQVQAKSFGDLSPNGHRGRIASYGRRLQSTREPRGPGRFRSSIGMLGLEGPTTARLALSEFPPIGILPQALSLQGHKPSRCSLLWPAHWLRTGYLQHQMPTR